METSLFRVHNGKYKKEEREVNQDLVPKGGRNLSCSSQNENRTNKRGWHRYQTFGWSILINGWGDI